MEAYTTEIGIIKSEIRFMIKHLHHFMRPQKVKTPLLFPAGSCFTIAEPLGVVLIMGTWNYPFHLTLMPLVGAIAAGNCAIIKPSELAPRSSALIKRIIGSTYPEDFIAAVDGGAQESAALLDQKFDYIFYTGGGAVGRLVMAAAARNLTPVTLELGGKSPCIVDKDADIACATRRIAFGKYSNAGQTCIAPDYALVHEEIKDSFLSGMQEVIEVFFGPDPQKSGDYGRIINKRHFHRLVKLMGHGNFVIGGQKDEEDLYISPTVMDGVSWEDPIMQEEIFGPVLPVITYEDLDNAIQMINRRPKPLALYIFSNNKDRQARVISRTSSGGACINDTISHIVPHSLPFGGVGESGTGSYHGRASFETFSHRKSILKTSTRIDIKSKYPPYKIPLAGIKKIMQFMTVLN